MHLCVKTPHCRTLIYPRRKSEKSPTYSMLSMIVKHQCFSYSFPFVITTPNSCKFMDKGEKGKCMIYIIEKTIYNMMKSCHSFLLKRY